MNAGLYIVGTLKGVATKEWRKIKDGKEISGENHDIGIAVSTEGKWGSQEHVYEVQCSNQNVERYREAAAGLEGKQVRIKVGVRAIGYGQGQAFEKFFALNESQIELVK